MDTLKQSKNNQKNNYTEANSFEKQLVSIMPSNDRQLINKRDHRSYENQNESNFSKNHMDPKPALKHVKDNSQTSEKNGCVTREENRPLQMELQQTENPNSENLLHLQQNKETNSEKNLNKFEKEEIKRQMQNLIPSGTIISEFGPKLLAAMEFIKNETIYLEIERMNELKDHLKNCPKIQQSSDSDSDSDSEDEQASRPNIAKIINCGPDISLEDQTKELKKYLLRDLEELKNQPIFLGNFLLENELLDLKDYLSKDLKKKVEYTKLLCSKLETWIKNFENYGRFDKSRKKIKIKEKLENLKKKKSLKPQTICT